MYLKSLGIAFAMAVGLFFYGYFLSTAGHDHSAHQESASREKESNPTQEKTHADSHDHLHR